MSHIAGGINFFSFADAKQGTKKKKRVKKNIDFIHLPTVLIEN